MSSLTQRSKGPREGYLQRPSTGHGTMFPNNRMWRVTNAALSRSPEAQTEAEQKAEDSKQKGHVLEI